MEALRNKEAVMKRRQGERLGAAAEREGVRHKLFIKDRAHKIYLDISNTTQTYLHEPI